MNPQPPGLYAIGRVEKAFGIKGELIVKPMTESPGRFKKLKQVYLGRQEKQAGKMTVEYVRVDARGVRLKFVDVADRTAAHSLVGSLIFVDEKQVVTPQKGSHFIHEVIGLQVVDEGNNNMGVVKDVLQLPGHDVYVIDHDGHEWMIPAVKEFVTSVDVESKTMKVRVIEGMINP